MKNVDKDELLELILSEDKEIRKLGISLLSNNFDLPEKLYCMYDKYGYYYIDKCPQKSALSFSLNKDQYLEWFENQFVSKEQKTLLLSTIFKYNEEYRQR